MSTWLYIFLLHGNFFKKKTDRKFTLKKPDCKNPSWGTGKLLIHRKTIFERNNFAKNDLHTPWPAPLAEMTTTTTLTYFLYYRSKNSNVSRKLADKTQDKRFIVYC